MKTLNITPRYNLQRYYRNYILRNARGLKLRSTLGHHGTSPNFIILGIQKGGTNAARYNLHKHPQINIVQDEIHYFDKKYFLPLWWYENHFVKFKQNVLNGEATPVYMSKQSAVDRIQRNYPYIKLIVIIREPIQRAFSKWNRIKLKNDRIHVPTKPFGQSVVDNDERLLSNGFYSDQIEYILSKFSKENLYIAISEQTLKRPAEEYNKMVRFLGLPEYRFEGLRRKNKSVYSANLQDDDVKMLYDLYQPHNSNLYHLLGGRIEEWDDFYGHYGLT